MINFITSAVAAVVGKTKSGTVTPDAIGGGGGSNAITNKTIDECNHELATLAQHYAGKGCSSEQMIQELSLRTRRLEALLNGNGSSNKSQCHEQLVD